MFDVMISLRNVQSLVDMQHIRGYQIVGSDDLSWIDISKIAGYRIDGFIGRRDGKDARMRMKSALTNKGIAGLRNFQDLSRLQEL